MMKIGLRAHDYGKRPVEELIRGIKADGFEAIQLALPKAIAGINSYYEVNEALLRQISEVCKQYEVEIAVLGCYVDGALLDETQRRKEVATFLKAMEYVRPLEAACIGTETTSFTYGEAYREEMFNLFVQSAAMMAEKAEELQVDIGIEPVASHTINTPERAKKLLDVVGSKRLKIIFDPVNLLTLENIAAQDQLWERCFENFGEKICALHIKGVKLNEAGILEAAPLEQGAVHFDKIASWLKQYKPHISLLREEIDPKTALIDRRYIRETFF